MLVLGTATLVWLLVQRQQAQEAAAPATPATAAMGDLVLPAGLRVEQASLDGRHVLLLLRGPDQQQYLAVVNSTTGERLSLLRIVAEGP